MTQGNQFFKDGDFEEAVDCYEQAIAAYGPKAIYMNNLAAALLKLSK